MVKPDLFAFALLAVSVLTGLIVQAIKAIVAEHHGEVKKPNTLAGIVAVILAVALSFGFAAYTGAQISTQFVLAVVALSLLSWLCAMLGYDKVIQTLAQLKR